MRPSDELLVCSRLQRKDVGTVFKRDHVRIVRSDRIQDFALLTKALRGISRCIENARHRKLPGENKFMKGFMHRLED
eukprot:2164997-Pleurochrysis_carterae.AAC.1